MVAPQRFDRRATPRHSCMHEVYFRSGSEIGSAAVRDVSVTGIGLILDHAVPAGSTLSVELPNRAQTDWQLKLSCVAHATPHEQNRWLIGSRFLRDLTEEELRWVLE
jgi:hypothetical protein